ncbi:DUF1205 domain-containing protein [Streptomyces sp. RB6PN25]|uniref:DUF1205 domain-containing protein n=1 Tax=Streptomyces humicola TaxID=2953240 RepID=A0ABT1Q2X2_9ACTN|nr:nucleotide disphospho-sugar-binding domain-containing protein [Streptomyces humicola]MCQ4084234.1 DUF1205 domain-containing protein [Streptomyces humicola]
MRVLFTTWAWPSHLYALVPLAWACRSAGHEVLVASQPRLLEDTVRTGLPAATIGEDVDAVELVRGYVLPTASDTPTAQSAPAPASGAGKGPRAMRMFLAHAESMTGGLVRLAREWRPDAVVFEPTAFAGPIAAAALGVPAVRLLYGTDLMLRARGLLPDVLAPLAGEFGAAGFDPFGTVTVDPTPAGLQVHADYSRLPMRYVPFNGPGELPPALPKRDGRPRICVTWGHTMAKLDPSYFLAGRMARAAAKTGAEVMVAVSAEQRQLLGELPEEVRVFVDAPLDPLLRQCDAVISHGGAGSVLTALRNGLPLLLVPQLPDHAGHAGRVLAAGAGEVLTRDEATPGRVGEEITRLLADCPERTAARALQAEIAAQPAPCEVASQVERLVGKLAVGAA